MPNVIDQITEQIKELESKLKQFRSLSIVLDNAKTSFDEAREAIASENNEARQAIKEARDVVDFALDENERSHKAVEDIATHINSSINSFHLLAKSVEDLANKIDGVDFPIRLDKLEVSVNQTLDTLNTTKKETIDELKLASSAIAKVNFEKKFIDLQDLVNNVVSSSHQLAKTIDNLKITENFQSFEQKITSRLSGDVGKAVNRVESLINNIERFRQENHRNRTEQEQLLNQKLRPLEDGLSNLVTEVVGVSSAVDTKIDELVKSIKSLKDDLSEQSIRGQERSQLLSNIIHVADLQAKQQKVDKVVTWILILIVGGLLFAFS